MRKIGTGIAILLAAGCAAQEPAPDPETALAPVRAFYAAYDDGFTQPADYATEDWNHINPFGGRRESKAATLEEVRAVHGTFLKGATDTIEKADVRFATPDVAVATVLSRTSPILLPDATEATAYPQIRTFVVVRRDGQWLIMQDHNTNVGEPGG